MYRLKVRRSTISSWPFIIRAPPTVMTATDRRVMKNSREPVNMPISLWNSRLEVLKRSFAALNLANSTASLAKAFAVRMPEREDSISALMAAVLALTFLETALIFRRRMVTTTTKMGRITQTTRASRHSIENITMRAPTMVSTEMIRSSGPWWASSVTSKRSLVSRLISWPVRLRS